MGRRKAGTLTRSCEICGTGFETPDTIRGRERVTCSHSCASKVAIRRQAIQAECCICNSVTDTTKSVVTAGLPVYCETCSVRRHSRICVICNKAFQAKKADVSCCSRECVTELNRRKLVDVKCTYCGLEFQRPSFSVYAGKQVFCSTRCSANQYSLDNPSRYGGTWSRRSREAKERDGYRCLLCGSGDNLETHHFIGIEEFDDPNDAHYDDNLGTFCKPCHREMDREIYTGLRQFNRRYSPTSR